MKVASFFDQLQSCEKALWLFVPRTGEMSQLYQVFGEEPLSTRPLLSRQLIGDLHTVAVRILEVDADRDAMISYLLDRHAFVLQSLVEFLQVLEARHHP